jgi:hypothetical protein
VRERSVAHAVKLPLTFIFATLLTHPQTHTAYLSALYDYFDSLLVLNILPSCLYGCHMLLALIATVCGNTYMPPESTPRNYVTYKLGARDKIVLDGRIDEKAWTDVAFTEPFVDIQTNVTPRNARERSVLRPKSQCS